MTAPMNLPPGYGISPMTEAELRQFEAWINTENWNLGVGDVDVIQAYDPEAFLALRYGSEMVAGGLALAYGTAAGYFGLVMVRRDLRHRQLGGIWWRDRVATLMARLRPTAPIQTDGIPGLGRFYAEAGFRALHGDSRFAGPLATTLWNTDERVIDLSQLPSGLAGRFDHAVMMVPREAFFERWIGRTGMQSVAVMEAGRLSGLACLRPAHRGWRIGPVYATNVAMARRLLARLLAGKEGEWVQLDVPLVNPGAVQLAKDLGLSEVLPATRLVRGVPPAADYRRVFGITSMDVG